MEGALYSGHIEELSVKRSVRKLTLSLKEDLVLAFSETRGAKELLVK